MKQLNHIWIVLQIEKEFKHYINMEKKSNNKRNQEKENEIKPLFEDYGNFHEHDEKSYFDLKNK